MRCRQIQEHKVSAPIGALQAANNSQAFTTQHDKLPRSDLSWVYTDANID